MKKCVIICAGNIEKYETVKCELDGAKLIICADAGVVHAQNMGVKPDIILGDFDSYTGEIPECRQVIKLPAEKDDTDTMYAVKLALDMGFDEFVLLGALGGRLDHTLANIQTLKYLQSKNAFGRLVGEDNIVFLVSSGEIKIKRRTGFKLSVFSYSDVCYGVTLKNVHYLLNDYTLDNRFPLGVSNEFEGDFALVSVKDGDLLIILSRD